MKKVLILTLIAVSIFLFSGESSASLISSIADPNGVVTFSDYNVDWIWGAGPQQVGNLVGEDIAWSSTNSGSVIGSGGYGLDQNGTWDNARVGYVGLNTSYGTMRFDFNSGLVNSVGGFVNYATGYSSYGVATIYALGINDEVLESYALDISTPYEYNAGEFWGISRESADIKAFALSNAYIVLDDLTYQRGASVVPEPATMTLLGSGLLGLIGFRRKRS